jgi:hypothetical protein
LCVIILHYCTKDMKNALFTLLLISSSFVTLAQSPTFAWAKRWGGLSSGADGIFAYDMVVDSANNSYVISNGGNQVNFNPTGSPSIIGPTSRVIGISKFASDGTLIWIKFIYKTNVSGNSSASVFPYRLAIKNNQLYIVGEFYGQVNFDPSNNFTMASSGENFILNLDTDGNFNWVKRFSLSTVNDIEVDNLNNLVLVGTFQNTMTISTNLSVASNGGKDAFVAKWDANGNPMWLKGFGHNDISSTDTDEAFGLDCSNSNDIFVVGGYHGTVDFDPGNGVLNYSSQGEDDIFVQKFTSTGDLIWAKSIGSSSTDRANSICVDNQGSIVFTGASTGTVDFDPSPSVSNAITPTVNAFVCKWSENAVFQWVKTIISTNSNPQGYFITNDLQNNYYVAGISGGSADFDPSNASEFFLSCQGIYSTFILKLTQSGSFLWAGILEQSQASLNCANWPASIYSNSTGIYLSGAFKGSLDFNTSSNVYTELSSIPQNVNSAYVLKLDQCLSTSNTITTSSCTSYNAPDGQVFTQSGQYTSTLSNTAGCDSVVTINLTIHPPSSSTITASSCSSYTAPDGQVFTQSGQYTSTLTNAAGCDSVVTINLTIHQPSIGTITTSSCSSYTAPDGQIHTQSGQYTSTLTNAAGCDSLITINLTIHQPSSSSISETACKEYIAPDGQVYTQSGSYTSIIPNSAGCDSTINIALTINTITAGISQNGIELSSTTNGAQYQWIRCESNSPISGATSQNFTATANGQYAVVVTQNNCSDTSNCVTVNTVGVHELNFGNIIIYPNPVRDVIHVSAASNLIEQIVITNVIGELLISEQHVNSLNVFQLAPGLYELIFVIDGQKNVQRFIKE